MAKWKTASRRALEDTERFRQTSPLWFWVVEVMGGGALFGIVGGLLGDYWTPKSATPFWQNAYPTIGGGIGVVFGFVVVSILIYLWNLFRAPYRQRNEARKDFDNKEQQIDSQKQLIQEMEKKHAKELASLKDNTLNIALELEAVSVLLNGVEVSLARLFWGLRDFFARGLGETTIPQLISSRFQEKNPNIWTSSQSALITTLSIKKLIKNEQRQTTRHGTETHFLLTELGSEVLDLLSKKFVNLEIEVGEVKIDYILVETIDTITKQWMLSTGLNLPNLKRIPAIIAEVNLIPSRKMHFAEVWLECENELLHRSLQGVIPNLTLPHYLEVAETHWIEFPVLPQPNEILPEFFVSAWLINEMMRLTRNERTLGKIKIKADAKLWPSVPFLIPTKIDEPKPLTSHTEGSQA